MKNEDEKRKEYPSLFGETEGKSRLVRFFLIISFILSGWIIAFLIYNL